MALIKQTTPERQQAMTLQTGEAGFVLIELLVVIGIIIVIAASVLTVIPGIRQKTQEKATKAFIERLEIAIEQYYSDNRVYPSTGITNLKTTLQPPDPTSKQYIEFNNSEVNNNDIVDYWGNPFVYTQPGTKNTTTYDIFSPGVNGTSATFGDDADDINNWSR